MSNPTDTLPAQIRAQGSERNAARRSAAWISEINHPNVAEVAEVKESEHETIVQFVHVSGTTLSEANKTMTLREMFIALASVARTLDDLHRGGVVHGAITANILIYSPPGRVVVSGLMNPDDRLLHTTPDDDTSSLLEMARTLLAEHTENESRTNISRIESQLHKTLLANDLPTCGDLVSTFTRFAEITLKPVQLSSRPHIRTYGRVKLIAIATGLALAVVTAELLKPTPNKSSEIKTLANGDFTVGNQTFNISEPNLLVYAGHFSCTSENQVAVLRPQEHTVWLFTSPDPVSEQEATFVGQFQQAKTLTIRHDGICDRIYAVGNKYKKELSI